MEEHKRHKGNIDNQQFTMTCIIYTVVQKHKAKYRIISDFQNTVEHNPCWSMDDQYFHYFLSSDEKRSKKTTKKFNILE